MTNEATKSMIPAAGVQKFGEHWSYLDVSDRTLVTLEGPDGQDLLQRVSTNDLSRLTMGASLQTILTNEKGRIIDVVSVMKTGDQELLLASQSNNPAMIVGWLEKFIIMEDARVREVTGSYRHFLIFGPDVLVPNESIMVCLTKELAFLGSLISSRIFLETWGDNTTFTHCVISAQSAQSFENLLQQNGVLPASGEQFEIFRLQHGIPTSPNELSQQYNPLEAGLTDKISFTKGCYIGQEVIARLDTYDKVQRSLVKFEMDAAPDSLPAPLYVNGEVVGQLTSAGRSQTGKVFGLGYVKRTVRETVSRFFIIKDNRETFVKILNKILP